MPPRLKFSIIIPAHNEANHIAETLAHVAALEYPKDMYETFVIENGSTDDTLAIARTYGTNTATVLQSGKGVSKAKNLGIDHLSPESDWVIFLDADTVLKKDFLNELNDFLGSAKKNFAVGTTSIRPLSQTRKARLWFGFYNLGHRLTKVSSSIKIVRRSLFPELRFDEMLTLGEDIRMIVQARMHGEFFFMPTKNVLTSTRRFDKEGWWYIFFLWTFGAILPPSLQRKFTYKVVR